MTTTTSTSANGSKKRSRSSLVTSNDTLSNGVDQDKVELGQLSIQEDEHQTLDEHHEQNDDDDDDDDDEHEEFPELDVGDNDSDDDDDDEDEDDSIASDDFEDQDKDEQLLMQELEDEQRDNIISSSSDDDDDDDDLDSLIKQHTTKPDESPSTSWEPDSNLQLDYMKRGQLVKSQLTGEQKWHWDDEIDGGYGSDSSTEQTTNRVGNVPSYWYDELPHIGYDMNGQKIMRPATGDELDKFLEGIEDDTGGWTTVKDKLHQQNVQLTEDELELIQRLAKAENPDVNYDPYEPTIPYFTSKVMDMPLSAKPEPKSRFLPSKWEHKKIMKIVRAIRSGRIVPRRPGSSRQTTVATESSKPPFYGLWSTTDQSLTPHPMHMPAPKLTLPGHEESYNPPEEYIWSKQEQEEFQQLDEESKKNVLVPKKYSNLRLVPRYENFVQERFERCLDLYLAPRTFRRKPKLDIKDASELIPKLPSPQELKPFPTTKSIDLPHPVDFKIRCCSIDPTGMWILTGSEDGQVRLWEFANGRCAYKWQITKDGPIVSVEWCPDQDKSLFAVAAPHKIHLISPQKFISETLFIRTKQFCFSGFTTRSTDDQGNVKKHVQPINVHWSKSKRSNPSNKNKDDDDVVVLDDNEDDEGRLIEIDVPGTLKQIVWHKRGDYFSSVGQPFGGSNSNSNQQILIHQLTKHQTQNPFGKLKGGDVQKVLFHPTKPHFLVATQRNVKIYDLMKQSLVKTLNPGVKWISSLDVHPLGDNVLVGSYDRRVVWHDLELSSTPYKTLRFHSRAVRSVSFHSKFPLFFSISDDGLIHVFHSSVYNDLLTNALIVPLKVLRGGHEIKDSLGVLDAKWHPTEPWIVSVGADGMGRIWST
ncbi:Ribosome biogenesis protein erb1 [Microbotryomycetes sp. JL221]|nr:Ribosome biogenesis protein erb1 [Microbotryomycetes sp. JL221]